jgi:bacterioferritin-associated ferredoxin
MFICVCNAITDKDIEDARAKGVTTHDEVFAHFGAAPRCGRCIESMCERMDCACESERSAAAA